MKGKSESEVAQSCPTLTTPWTAAYQVPPSMGFSRQKYWSGVPFSLETRIPECGTDKTNNPMSCQKVVSAMKENKALGVGKGRVERG